MIERIIIDGYRLFDRLEIEPNPGMNIIVGDNESGKSTLLEAIALALTGKINGRWAEEELNPFWFKQGRVKDFFERRLRGEPSPPPSILIECYLTRVTDEAHTLRGVHNSRGVDAIGISMTIAPSDDYAGEFNSYLAERPPAVLPVEFYEVVWQDFSGLRLGRRPKELAVSFIDSRTIRSTSGVDYHTRQILSEHLDPKERALISLDQRRSRQQITDGSLAAVNARIAEEHAQIHDRRIGLQLLPRRLLRDRTGGRRQPHRLRDRDRRVPRVQRARGQRPLDAAARVGLPRALRRRPLVRLRAALAGGPRRGLRARGRARRNTCACGGGDPDRDAHRARGAPRRGVR
jgi:energy-coupling factor transporter ATP-binding protein EcfA2